MTLDESRTSAAVARHAAGRADGNAQPKCAPSSGSPGRCSTGGGGVFEQYGPEGLHPRRVQGRRGRPVEVAPETKRMVQGVATSAGTWGCGRIAGYLAHAGNTTRPQHGPANPAPGRPGHALRTAGGANFFFLKIIFFFERTRRRLWRARHGHARHAEGQTPGQLEKIDTFDVGQLKGVGKSGRSRPAMPSARTGWRGGCPPSRRRPWPASCERSSCPHYHRADWPVQRVLTYRGPEFKGAFDDASRALGIRRTRTKPQHAWTNGFVERFQGTILRSTGAWPSAIATSPVAPASPKGDPPVLQLPKVHVIHPALLRTIA